MNQIDNIFNSLIPRNIYRMNAKYSAYTIVNHYNNDLSNDFVHHIIQLKSFFSKQISKFNLFNDLVKCIMANNYSIALNFPDAYTACFIF